MAKIKFEVELTLGDVERILSLLKAHGRNDAEALSFNSAELYRDFDAWLNFVETEWADWDSSEYDHDIGCRYWIQLAIENSEPATRDRLERAVSSIDALFKQKMLPARNASHSPRLPLREGPYFWETHTIHPD